MTNPPSGDTVAVAVGKEATQELREAQERIQHCLGQLTDEQIWWRPGESQNSIGNLVLHLCGNLRQWIVAGIDGGEDLRNRPQEFSERGPIPKSELLSRLESVVGDAAKTLATLAATELLKVRRIQGFEISALAAIFHTIPHFRGHTQEIIFRTRLALGDRYQFAWQPQTPEQGAPT